MKAYIISGGDIFKGDIKQIQTEPAEIKFIFFTSPEIVIKKENYNENVFNALTNVLKNLVVSAEGIHIINLAKGTVEKDGTRSGLKQYNSSSLNSINKSDPNKANSEPLIQGKFTQAPQGAVDKLDQSVLDSFTI